MKTLIDDVPGDSPYYGSVGTNWCPAGSTVDKQIFEELRDALRSKGKIDLANDADLLLSQNTLFPRDVRDLKILGSGSGPDPDFFGSGSCAD